MDFCADCGELLSISENKDKLKYTCNSCNKLIDASNDAYLVYQEKTKTSYDSVNLKFACEDITNPRKIIKCPNCDNKEKIAILIRLPETLENIYICCECQNIIQKK